MGERGLPHTCIEPPATWDECLCEHIDPSDWPCIVCEGRAYLTARCAACQRAVIEYLLPESTFTKPPT